MNESQKKSILNMQLFYMLTFFGVGSLFPLLSVYLSGTEHLDGIQIGTIMSVGPIMMIFFQPLWGIICDITNAPARVLSVTTVIAGIFSLGYLMFHQYILFLMVAVCIAIFQSAIIPVSDSISLKYTSKINYNYGNVRLFGSLGFGIAVFIMGKMSEGFIGPKIIFFSFLISLAAASLLALNFPKEKAAPKLELKKGIKELFSHKKFILFLIVTFMIFGPNLANNVYFGLFVKESGGSYGGIGIAFLIAVLSEVPFMRLAGGAIKKWGLLPVAALAGCVSLIRWVFYFMEPSLGMIYASAMIQGASIGLFIPAGLQYIKEITPAHITATAVTIYSAIGNGLGNWFSTFTGGILYDRFSIYTVYLFFGFLALIGVILTLILYKEEKSPGLNKNYANS